MTTTANDPSKWVDTGQAVRAFSTYDPTDTYGYGTVFAHAPFPTVCIRRPDGTAFEWGAHLCEPADSIPADAPTGPAVVDRAPLVALAERWQRMADEFDGDNWVPLDIRDIKDEQDRDRAVASWRESTRAQTFAMRDCARQLRALLAEEDQT